MGHLLGVAAIVIDDGGTENEAIAALLHDGPEDQGGQEALDRIRREFGEEVADIIEALSDTLEEEKPPWKARKVAYLKHLSELPDTELTGQILRVSLADKLHNVRAISFDWEREGDKVWTRFRAPREDQLWYYVSLGEIYAGRLGDVPLVRTYLKVSEELTRL